MLAGPGWAQETEPPPLLEFIGGAAIGLGVHEAGHLVFDCLFDASPRLRRVELGGFPFFAITHRDGLSPRREFSISAAGFWAQYLASERILSRRPNLRDEPAPVVKGMFAFHVGTSVGYGVVALMRGGPGERDTRGMAFGSRVDERVIGGLVLIPAALDAYRYMRPGARWPVWVSRAAKVGTVALLLR